MLQQQRRHRPVAPVGGQLQGAPPVALHVPPDVGAVFQQQAGDLHPSALGGQLQGGGAASPDRVGSRIADDPRFQAEGLGGARRDRRARRRRAAGGRRSPAARGRVRGKGRSGA